MPLFGNHHGNNWFSQVSLIDANTARSKFDEKQDIILKYLSTNHFLSSKRKTYFAMEKQCRHHFNTSNQS